jgi:hypothetical protein
MMEADLVSFGILEVCNTANRSVNRFADLDPLATKVGDRFGDVVDFEVDSGCAAGLSSDPFERRNAKIPLANSRLSVLLRPVLNVWRVEGQLELTSPGVGRAWERSLRLHRSRPLDGT